MIFIWMNLPSHHQVDFFKKINKSYAGLRVLYYGKISKQRENEGWSEHSLNINYEEYVSPSIESLKGIEGWRNGVHIIPGYGSRFLRNLSIYFSNNNVAWIHWSEKANPGLLWWASYPLKRMHANRINNHALGALAIGTAAANDFINWGIKREKIAHLPYSISDVDNLEPDQNITNFSAGRKVFLFVGSLYDGKGVDLLLAAFAKISKYSSDWCLVLVGKDRTNGHYTRQANRLGIAESVLFRGVIPALYIGSAFSAAHVLVLPSRYDGWGMVVNEAASVGLPLIVSDAAGAAWHMVDHSVNGFRFTSGNVHALHSAMFAYVVAPDLLALHGNASKHMFYNQSSDVMSKRFLSILHTWQALRT